ncbi:hypothetical protein [Frankia sp. Cj3]|uniref:hypothetical protein n=1 Tax=Frankia sp. Cj3 TaxID=2880976 RepID=UPI001EF50269|nr:hypothetical protein [Frankia sp. Cj3]
MAKAGYTASTLAAVALSAATAKTILFVTATANFGMDLKKFRVGFDGVTASAVPVLVELCYNTAATNSTAGTNNTTVGTPNQVYGRSITAGFTGGYSCTSEPTVLTAIDRWTLTPNGGLVIYDFPLGDTPDAAVSNGFALRCTAPAAVNVNATMWWERI